MANTTVSILIRFKESNKRRTVAAAYAGKARLKPGIGIVNGKERPCPGAIYWLRWYNGPKQVWRRVGPDPHDAVVAQMNREAVLCGERLSVEAPKNGSRRSLAEAVEDFLTERSTQTDERGLKRWRWELDLFQKVCGKAYLHEVSRADFFAYMRWYQQRKKAPRTVYNRMVSINVFLKQAKHTVGFVFSQQKNGGDIPDYAEKAVDRYYALDLKRFFVACDAYDAERAAKGKGIQGETRLRYLFFLDSGCREREVMFACQSDFRFEPEDGEYASTYEVCPKPDLGFKTKTGKTRVVPLTPRLAKALQTWFVLIGDRPRVRES